MERISQICLLAVVLFMPLFALAGEGYTIAGKSGFIHFIEVESAQQTNEDVYRLAVAEACAGKPVCQAQFWINKAPTAFPLTADQADSKVVHWQQNLNTGMRRWLVKCSASQVFSNERECI